MYGRQRDRCKLAIGCRIELYRKSFAVRIVVIAHGLPPNTIRHELLSFQLNDDEIFGYRLLVIHLFKAR